MTALTRPIRRLLGRADPDAVPSDLVAPAVAEPASPGANVAPSIAVEIGESDPLLAYLQSAPGPVDD